MPALPGVMKSLLVGMLLVDTQILYPSQIPPVGVSLLAIAVCLKK